MVGQLKTNVAARWKVLIMNNGLMNECFATSDGAGEDEISTLYQ